MRSFQALEQEAGKWDSYLKLPGLGQSGELALDLVFEKQERMQLYHLTGHEKKVCPCFCLQSLEISVLFPSL